MRIVHRGLSDVGRKRSLNEDSFLESEELGLFIVADGMGGHAGGGTASRIAIEEIERLFRERSAEDGEVLGGNGSLEDSRLPELLRESIEAASASIFGHALRDPGLAGMGTTVTALLLRENYAFFGHVGDSRAYLIREGAIVAITEDHSVVQEQLRAGLITEEEARRSRFKNIITRSVGFEDRVLVDVMAVEVEVGDVILLCSDGLTSFVEDPELAELGSKLPIAELPSQLIDLANERGGDDNITVIAIKVEDP